MLKDSLKAAMKMRVVNLGFRFEWSLASHAYEGDSWAQKERVAMSRSAFLKEFSIDKAFGARYADKVNLFTF